MRLTRQVVKGLFHRPWYSLSIVTVMAIATSLLTSVFAIVDGVLFKPLGYPAERELVAIQVSSSRSASRVSIEAHHLTAWAAAAPEVSLTGFSQSGGGVATVQQNFFDVIGVRPAIGGFTAADFEGPRSGVSWIEPRVVTDEIFQSQFGRDSNAIGRIVTTDPSTGRGYRVVGVMPRGFVFPTDRSSVGYLAPQVNGGWIHLVIARMPAGTTTRELAARVVAAGTTWDSSRQSRNGSPNLPIDQANVESLGRALGASSRPLFLALLASAALLVASAALNASSLMAARSVDRRRELAVRRALGATPFDIGRLLLVEAGVLVGTGAAIGLLIAAPLLGLAAALLPADLALFRTVAIDWRVAVFSVALTLMLAVLVTAWPLRLASNGDAAPGDTRSVTGQAHSLSWRLVVTAQVALALVLTTGGALLVGSLLSVYAQTPAITTESVLSIPVQFLGMPTTVGRDAPGRATRVNALLERVRSVPGVEAVALTGYDLLEHAYQPSFFELPATARKPIATILHAVTADFYRIVEPELIAGRWPNATELASNHPVIVVSEAAAANHWPNATAIGQTLTNKGGRDKTAMTFTVVGVVRDVRWYAWDEETTPTVYGPYALLARQTSSAVLISTSAGLSRVAEDALRAMGDTDPLLRTGRVAPLDQLFVDSVRPRRFQAWLFGSFAFASLFVVGLGIFGQLAMSTARRTREVGIRMTCGATSGSIARLILREQLMPVVVGLVVGGLIAAWAVQFVRSYLYEVTSSDPRVWAAAIALILLTAAVGTLVPALRASRIDPTRALRAE